MSDIYDTYAMRRLKEVSGAPDLTPSMKLDLALDDSVSDDHLEEISNRFGAQKPSGWGISDMVTQLLSREPTKVKANDLVEMQQNLIQNGYAHPDTPVDGVWTPEWANALRRADRDAQDSQLQGNHQFAAPLMAGLRLVGNVMPSAVYQGVIGMAKGMVEQAPETAERVGLLGGAASGAGIGAAVGVAGGPFAEVTVPVGATVGAVIGGAIGFFGDIFGKDEGEEGQTVGQSVWDAVTPFEEYTGPDGVHKFVEDLGFVATAASLVTAAGAAAGAVRTGASAIGEAGGLMNALRPATTRALAGEAGGASPGLFTKLAAKAVGAEKGSALLEKASLGGLNAWREFNPVLKEVTGLYTSASSAQLTARYLGGVGSGEEGEGGVTTTLEKAMEEAPKPPLADVLDWTVGSVVLPTKFFAGASEAAQGLRNVFAADVIEPYMNLVIRATRDVNGEIVEAAPGRGKAVEAVRKLMGGENYDPAMAAATDTMLKVNHGLYREMGTFRAELREAEPNLTRYIIDQRVSQKRSELIRTMREELSQGITTTRDRMLAYAEDNGRWAGQDLYYAYLKGIEGFGSDFDRVGSFKDSLYKAEQVARDFDKKGLTVAGTTRTTIDEAGNVKVRESVSSFKHPGEGGAVVPVRNFDLQNNIGGYTSQQDYLDLAQRLEQKTEAVSSANEALLKARESGKVGDSMLLEMHDRVLQAQEEFDALKDEIRLRDILENDDLERIGWGDPRKLKTVTKRLRDLSKQGGREIEGLDDETVKFFSDKGYRLVATGEDMLTFSDMPKMLESKNVAEWARDPNRWDTIKSGVRSLGLDPNLRTDRGLSRARMAHEEAELQDSLVREGIHMTGKQARRKISNWLERYNNGDGITNMGKAESGFLTPEGKTATLGPGRLASVEGKKVPRLRLYKLDPRELNPDHLIQALELDTTFARSLGDKDPYEVATNIMEGIRRGATLGGEASFAHPIDSARMLGKAMRVNGATGFSDFVRTLHYEDPRKFYGAIGAAAGAEIEREQGAGLAGITGGAVKGGIAGAGFGQLRGARAISKIAQAKGETVGLERLIATKFPKGTYGYLPDKLHRLNMALRYSFSIGFDAGRYMEQNLLAAEHGLPVIFQPQKYVQKKYGTEAWDEAKQYYDNISGGRTMQTLDDIDRRATQVGMLGFSPRHHEAAQAYILKQRNPNWSDDKVFEIVRGIGGYGLGRSAAEKTANFVFFPFSFQKKLLSSLGDFILQSPPRALLIHEGLRKFYGLTGEGEERSEGNIASKLGDFVDRHLPFLKQLQYLNNLAYGISPGRFFLQGLGDRKTDLGAAAEIFGNTLAPGGVATPLAQALGAEADALVHMFIPVVITDETPHEEAIHAVTKYIPLARELGNLGSSTVTSRGNAPGEQLTALTQGSAPYSQLTDYYDAKRELEYRYKPMAEAMGYSTVSGFLDSEVGAALKPEYDQELDAIRAALPTGFEMAQSFTNVEAINKNLIARLEDKPDRSEAEELIVRLAEMEQETKNMADLLQLPQQQLQAMVQSSLREEAMRHLDNREFVEYWNRLFASVYGPVERIAA